MSKIIVDQIQAPGGAVFALPKSGAAGQLLSLDAAGGLVFINSPASVQSTNNPATTTNAPLGQVWINSNTGEIFICTSATTNLNTWIGNKGTNIGLAMGQAIMTGTTFPTKTMNIGLGSVYIYSPTAEIFVCIDATKDSNRWQGSLGNGVNLPQGQQLFETVGTQSLIVPNSVNFLSAVLVGAGAGGSTNWANQGGGGGALAYANQIPVTPGETLTLIIGAGGSQTSAGGDTIIKRGSTVLFTAQGGQYAATSTRATFVSGAITAKGGSGGLCANTSSSGGGGAGGYSGNGGDGSYGSPNTGYGTQGPNGGSGNGGGGGGGSGYQSSTYGFGGGGGVGLYGEGASGAAGNSTVGNDFSYTSSGYGGFGGKGGSGGEQGSPNSNSSQSVNGRTTYSGEGGKFGGGGGGSGTSLSGNANFCRGGQGGARVIWGAGRAFPSTNTADVATVA